MDKDRFELEFDRAFEEAAKNHTVVPDPLESWKKVEKKLQRRRTRRQRLKMLPYIAASFILGAVIFSTPAVTNAFSPVFQTLKQIQEDMVTFIYGSNEEDPSESRTAPPNDTEKEDVSTTESMRQTAAVHQNYRTWEEAAPYVSFYPAAVSYVPEGFHLADVRLAFREGDDYANEAVLLYEKDHLRYRIMLELLEAGESITSATDKDSSKYEEIVIHGAEAILTVSADDRARLEYLYNNIYISISGSLSKEDIIQIAENIK
ncbi:DUF4367 domain-containing protein [Marinicrinis lubricantis]|uniref:DUF4367 domain-containing protein n=1 Tax=Marinicrinis lubricantis TaxID=2086470 RepID=A0ABW1IR06_9BACL